MLRRLENPTAIQKAKSKVTDMKLPDFGQVDLDYGKMSHNIPPDDIAYNPGKPSLGYPTSVTAKHKMSKIGREFKEGTLHSGKGGPVVTSHKQMVAIMLSAGRKAEKEAKKRKK